MYIPPPYLGKDKKAALAFMKRFNFATIVTAINNVPMATHLPFVISQKEDQVILTSYFSKENEHWKHILFNESLIVFSEPHAYVSPLHYDSTENVPSWNYLSVHAYGQAKIISNQEDALKVLQTMVNNFEPEYIAQWNALPLDYKKETVTGIVAFELVVKRLQSKEKLSQNKKEHERKSIISSFEKSTNFNEQTIAAYMKLKESETV